MENINNMDTSPATPKKRYSCASEYATPKESDDSDSSLLYYSFVEENAFNKENSVNGGTWTVSDSSSPIAPRVSKAKTPLLRKVLQSNHTPRNKNNKRVSFSHLSKPSPTPTVTVKIAKTEESEGEKVSDRNVIFDLKPIGESLPNISNVNQFQQKNEEKTENVVDTNTIDESLSSDVTDDLENELHNTIIENPPFAANSTLTSSNEEHDTPAASVVIPQQDIKASESNETHSLQLMNDLLPKTNPQLSKEKTVTSTRSIEELLREARKNVPQNQTRNAAKTNRQNLANDTRKSILPIAKKSTRATTYKRRSSTYEPRKVDPRKSLGVLKQIASKVTKTIGAQKNTASTVNATTNDVPRINASVASNSTQSLKITATKQPSKKSDTTSRMPTLKARQTLLASHPPRVPIVSTTRQSISTSVRSQRRETKYSLQSLAVAKASTSTSSHVPNSSSSQATFIKPTGGPMRTRSTITTNVTATSNSNGNGIVNGKCLYCDKFFAKSHGMRTHLLEKCEKIPAPARRQLKVQNKTMEENNVDEVNSKQVSRRKTYAFRQDIDTISKYSRLFANLTNEGASGMRGDGAAAIEVENGLKNLRAELRKMKGPHTGITRTPSKPIRCHICNKLFFDCVEYADHSTNHPPLD